MAMDEVSMAVPMRVSDVLSIMIADCFGRHRAQKAGYIHHAQDNQHHGDAQLHAETDASRNDEIEKNDARADHQDGESVANAPKCSNQGRPHAIALITDDGRDRNDVVGVGGMAHPQKKSHRENREKTDHVVTWIGAPTGRNSIRRVCDKSKYSYISFLPQRCQHRMSLCTIGTPASTGVKTASD